MAATRRVFLWVRGYCSVMDAERLSRYAFVPRRAPPLEIERAEGVYFYTANGRRILDAAGGAIVANVGHGRREVAEAVARELERASYVVPTFATEGRVRLVERLQESWLPPGLTRVFLASGGSESVDSALRLARLHHVAAGREGRFKVIGRDLSYHGTTLTTLAAGGNRKRRKGFEPLLQDWPKLPACYCLRCPFESAYPACEVACADGLEELIVREGADTIAAFIAEPVVGSTAGALVPPDEYWPKIAEICKRHGVLLIADEVMSGFGRTGRNFAVDHWGVSPDILVAGKGLAGGYAPMGGVFAKESVVAPLAERGMDLMYFTFSAHPGACAAAGAVLDILDREHLVERAAKMGERLRTRLRELESHPHVAEVRGLGLLQAVELVKDKATLESFPQKANVTARVVGAGLKNGVFFYPGGGAGGEAGEARDVIVLGPPFIIDDDQIDEIGAVLERSIDAATS